MTPGDYDFRTLDAFEAMGSDFFAFDQPFEMPGRSCFLQVDDRVLHTYSQFARGLESMGGSYYFLDLTPLGRQEKWGGAEGAERRGADGKARRRFLTPPRRTISPD